MLQSINMFLRWHYYYDELLCKSFDNSLKKASAKRFTYLFDAMDAKSGKDWIENFVKMIFSNLC